MQKQPHKRDNSFSIVRSCVWFGSNRPLAQDEEKMGESRWIPFRSRKWVLELRHQHHYHHSLTNTLSHTIKHPSTNITIPYHTIHFHSHFHHNTPFQPISLSQAINIKTHRITIHFIIKGVQSQSPFHSQLSLPFAIMSEDVRCVWWCEHPLRIWRGRDCVCGCFMKGDGCWLFDGRMNE